MMKAWSWLSVLVAMVAMLVALSQGGVRVQGISYPTLRAWAAQPAVARVIKAVSAVVRPRTKVPSSACQCGSEADVAAEGSAACQLEGMVSDCCEWELLARLWQSRVPATLGTLSGHHSLPCYQPPPWPYIQLASNTPNPPPTPTSTC
jgi:hypothetical protein